MRSKARSVPDLKDILERPQGTSNAIVEGIGPGSRPSSITDGTINVLFICSLNQLRSPTAAKIFAAYQGLVVDSAGVDSMAERLVTAEQIAWADMIFVMEEVHRQQLSTVAHASLQNKCVICLNIPDRYAFMQPALVRQLKSKVLKHLPPQPRGRRLGR